MNTLCSRRTLHWTFRVLAKDDGQIELTLLDNPQWGCPVILRVAVYWQSEEQENCKGQTLSDQNVVREVPGDLMKCWWRLSQYDSGLPLEKKILMPFYAGPCVALKHYACAKKCRESYYSRHHSWIEGRRALKWIVKQGALYTQTSMPSIYIYKPRHPCFFWKRPRHPSAIDVVT